MITWDDARETVRRAMAGSWRPELGTLYVADTGMQDDTHYLVTAGAREYLVDDDGAYMLMDAPALFVAKDTGELQPAPVIDSLDRIDTMRRAP